MLHSTQLENVQKYSKLQITTVFGGTRTAEREPRMIDTVADLRNGRKIKNVYT